MRESAVEATPLSDTVMIFVAQYVGRTKDTFCLTSRLNHDLGVNGDDAEELLTEFGKQFHVDLAGLLFSRYFDSEPHLFNGITWMRRYIRRIPSAREPLTVADLVDAARL